jgi:hypothetical protein
MSDIRMVAVPSGLTPDGHALVRVLVVPRLDSGALADFGLDDWPALLASATFELTVDQGDGTQIVAPAATVSSARSEIWQAFFGGDGSVIDDTVPGRTGSVNVHPRHDLAVQAAGIYRQAAVDMAAPDTPAQPVGQRLHGWQVTPQQQPPPPPSSNPAQPVSFNRVLATVRQHPAVLETLGLIFELSVNPADLKAKGTPPAGPWQGKLSLRCPEPPLNSLVTSPWTRYELTDEHGFWPASGGIATPPIEHGAIDLSQAQSIDDDQAAPGPSDSTPKWSVSTFDVDGAVRGLNAAKRASQMGTDGEDSLPALRSAGLALMRRGRQQDVNSRLAAASRFDALSRERLQAGTADEVLAAEDLLLGYRVDIRAGAEPSWRSLCKREATYTVNGLTIGAGGQGATQPGPSIEEGHLSALTAGRDDNGDLHADEIVLRWNGWSLAVPGISLLDQRDPAGPGGLPYNFAWQYRVPDQSLPPLRFGQVYRMRIRVADVTGGGLGEDSPDATAPPTGPLLYMRHDPIQPPRLSATGPLSLGAGVDRLVVRSDDRQGSGMVPDTRQLRPPAVPLQIAEHHGCFDGVSDDQSWAWAQQAMRTGTSAPAEAPGLPDPFADGINAFLPVQEGGSPDGDTNTWYPTDHPWPASQPRSIRLTGMAVAAPGTPGAPPAPPASLAWTADGVLVVRLAIGREAVLELSSTPAKGFSGYFAVGNWAQNAHVDLGHTAIGRNPMLSPAQPVHLVHAVRKPLVSPHWTLPDTAVGRPPGATYAELSPVFGGDGLDPGSTGRLEITAAWPEPVGPGVSGAFVHGEALPAEGAADPFPLSFLHHFGDTKHRQVTYTLTAISRFRPYFDQGGEPDADFQLVQTQPVVNVLSTARAPEADVDSVVPSFGWTATASDTRVERSRSSWRLRLALRGSWYRTGIGERLAVIVAPDPSAGGSPPFSLLGRDPVSVTGPVGPLLPLSWCAGAAQIVTGFTLADLNVPADLAVYDVVADGDSYFCDIELRPPAGAPASYCPFVRLSVARYQADSLADRKLSSLTMTDWAQLLPDRHVAVDRAAQHVVVTVDGLGPAPPNTVEVTLEELTADPADGQAAEAMIALGDGAAQVPAWRAVSGSAVASGTVGSPITVPVTPATRPRRLRIRETEPYRGIDGGAASDVPELTQRSPYIDVVDLPASWP